MKSRRLQLQWKRSVLVTAITLLLTVQAQAQDRVIPPVGGPGGSEFVARCPAGQLLGGVELRVGDDVDAIRPLCRMVSRHVEQILEPNNDIRARQKYSDYVTYPTSEAKVTTGWFGGRGSNKTLTVECNNVDGGPGKAAAEPIVSGIYVEAEGVDMVTVNRITLLCEFLTFGLPTKFRNDEWWNNYAGAPDFEAPKYADSHTGGFQSQPRTTKGTSICPVSSDNRGNSAFATVAVGIHGRSGAYVDAVGLICDFAKRPPPPLPRPTQYIVRNDFNNDGRGDILWHNSATGESQIWFMSGSSRIGRATISDGGHPTLIGPPWGIVGSRDFNGDGKTDLLWHNSSTGEAQIWYMNGSKVAGRATVLGEDGNPALVQLPWSIVGTSDKNGDSQPDIIWHNASTGEVQSWHLHANRVSVRRTVTGENGSYTHVGLPWRIVGANDFDGDGKTDLLWHNSSTGETQIWYMDNYAVTARATVLGENGSAALVGLPWSIVGTNDFNLDGTADILWHNESTGETQMWLMKVNRLVSRKTVLGESHKSELVGPPWSIMNQ